MECGERKTENRICENLLFCKFYDSSPSPGRGFFGRLRLPQNDGGNRKRSAENGKQKTEFVKICFFVNFTILLAQKAGDSSAS